VAQIGGTQLVGFPGGEDGKPARIKIIEGTFQFLGRFECQSPTAPQIWRGFERTITPSVIVFGDADNVLGVSKRRQIITTLVVTMRQDKTVVCLLDQDLS